MKQLQHKTSQHSVIQYRYIVTFTIPTTIPNSKFVLFTFFIVELSKWRPVRLFLSPFSLSDFFYYKWLDLKNVSTFQFLDNVLGLQRKFPKGRFATEHSILTIRKTFFFFNVIFAHPLKGPTRRSC